MVKSKIPDNFSKIEESLRDCLTPFSWHLFENIIELEPLKRQIKKTSSGSNPLDNPRLISTFKRLTREIQRKINLLSIQNPENEMAKNPIVLRMEEVPIIIMEAPQPYQKKYKSSFLITFPHSETIVLFPYTLYQCAERPIIQILVNMLTKNCHETNNQPISTETFVAWMSVAHHAATLDLDLFYKKIIAYFSYLGRHQADIPAFDPAKMKVFLDLDRDESVISRRTWNLMHENVVTPTFRVNWGNIGFYTYYYRIHVDEIKPNRPLKALIPKYYPLCSLIVKNDPRLAALDYESNDTNELEGDTIHAILHVPYTWRLNEILINEGAIPISNFTLSADLYSYFGLEPIVDSTIRKMLITALRKITLDDLFEEKKTIDETSYGWTSIKALSTVETTAELEIPHQTSWLDTHPNITDVKLDILKFFSSNQNVQQAVSTLASNLRHDNDTIARYLRELLHDRYLYYYPMYRRIGLNHGVTLILGPTSQPSKNTENFSKKDIHEVQKSYLTLVKKALVLISPIARTFHDENLLVSYISTSLARLKAINLLLNAKNHIEIRNSLGIKLRLIHSPKFHILFDHAWRQPNLYEFSIERTKDGKLLTFSHHFLPQEWQ